MFLGEFHWPSCNCDNTMLSFDAVQLHVMGKEGSKCSTFMAPPLDYV